MKQIPAVLMFIVMALLSIGTPCYAAEQVTAPTAAERTGETGGSTAGEGARVTLNFPLTSPLFSKSPIAVVNDEAITVSELLDLLATSHEKRADTERAGKTKMSFSEPLKRLINGKLIVLEARNAGLDELEEIRQVVDDHKTTILIKLLHQDLIKDITVNEKDVETVYAGMVKEWKVKSILFEKEEDARKAREAIASGATFEEVAGKALKDQTATGSEEGQYLPAKALNAPVLDALTKMIVGSVSPLIPIGGGKHVKYTLVKLEDERIPDIPEERAQARAMVLIGKRNERIQQYREALSGKYASISSWRLWWLDYESKEPGMEKLLSDERVLAKIAGEEPVLVKDLSRAIKEKFHHGVESAIEQKKVNAMKRGVLDEVIGKRVFRKEALLRGIDKTEEYQRSVKEKEDAMLFGAFVKKAIAPSAKISDDDVRSYYNEHVGEFTSPARVRFNGLAFNTQRDAESAFDKLKKGADYSWIKANAEGQAESSKDELLSFSNTMVPITRLPSDVQKALTGAKPGEFRLSAGSGGQYYILSVLGMAPARQQSIEEVIATITPIVFNTRLNQTIEEWAEKLKQSYTVKIYLQQ